MITIPSYLIHLRTDRRGVPVPFVNLWGVEDTAHLTVRYDHHVQDRAVFLDDADQDVPDFTRQNMQRQREAMASGLCQVCGRPVPWSRRHLVIADMTVERVELYGRMVPVIHEPWLDKRCATFALRHCPALIRRTRDEALTLVPVTSRRQVRLVVSHGWVDGHLEAETRARPVAMWVKALLLDPAISIEAQSVPAERLPDASGGWAR